MESSDNYLIKYPAARVWSNRTLYKMVQLYDTYTTASFSALIEETDMSKYGDIVPFETAQIANNEIVPIELAQTMVALHKEQLQVGSVI